MKKDLNKFYFGYIKQISNISSEIIFMRIPPFTDTKTLYSFKKIKLGIFYEYEKNKFIDICTKIKYNSDYSFMEVNELFVDRRTLIPIKLIFNELNISLIDNSKNGKISEKKLMKVLYNKMKTQN